MCRSGVQCKGEEGGGCCFSSRLSSCCQDDVQLSCGEQCLHHPQSHAQVSQSREGGLSFSFIRETVPARSVHVPGEMDSLYTSLDTDQIKLVAHPNIVEMVTVFADQVPGLPGDVQLYGDALPARLNPMVGVATALSWLSGL